MVSPLEMWLQVGLGLMSKWLRVGSDDLEGHFGS